MRVSAAAIVSQIAWSVCVDQSNDGLYLPYPAPGDLHEPVEGEGVEHDEDGEGDDEVDQAVEVIEVTLHSRGRIPRSNGKNLYLFHFLYRGRARLAKVHSLDWTH